MTHEEKARELARAINARWSSDADDIEEFAERDAPAIAQALQRERERALEEAGKSVPTNWCDSLLTGPDTHLTGNGGTWGCPHIEGLLHGVRGRIRALLAEASDPNVYPPGWDREKVEATIAAEQKRDKQAEPKWISVEERLPEVKDLVLAVMNLTDRIRIRQVAYLEGADWLNPWDNSVYEDVTHWMPLPAPPEQEAGGEK